MNMIEEQICNAIELIVQRAIDQASYDKTIQATIVKCIDQTIGKYSVQYQDSVFYAYSGSSEITYTNGSTVYVLIPGNDTEADKTILGTTKKLGINYVTVIEDDESYQTIGNNCITSNSLESFNLQSYKENKQVKILYSKTFTSNQNLINVNPTAINEYIKNKQTIICGATIRTELPTEQQFRGNYGLIFALNFTDNSNNNIVTRYYTVDVDKMRGNPYKMLYDTRQYGIFNIDGVNFIDVDSISIFCYNFPNSKPDSQCIDDIFIKDIELCGAERLSAEELDNYSLTFYTPQGIYFDGNSLESDTKRIEAQVRVKGKLIDNDSQQLPFYWFIEHAGITAESTYYNKYGGQGWKCLNNYTVIKKATETEPEVVEWIPSSPQWILSKKDITAKEVKYKCVAVYDGIIISKTIVIKNLASGYDISIISDQGTKFYFDIGYPTLECLVNGKSNSDLTYSWAVTNNVGNFETIPETPDLNISYLVAYNNYTTLFGNIQSEKEPLEPNKEKLNQYKEELAKYSKIMRVEKNFIWHLNVNTITNFSTYQCTVYQDETYLGTASITLTNSLTPEGSYSMVINNSSCIYKYNENGISPTTNAVDDPLAIKELSFNIYNNLGELIDSNDVKSNSEIQWIVPIRNTMIKIPESYNDYEEDEEAGIRIYRNLMSLQYKIAESFDITKNNNDIELMVNFKRGINLSSKTNLVFVKEGDGGTNGTEFFCRIVPNVVSGQEIPAYPTLTSLSNNSWSLNYQLKQANQFFKVQLWHNENLIVDSVTSSNSTEGKQATIKWSILKNKYNATTSDTSGLVVNPNTGVFTYSGYRNDSPANIIKAEVTYDGIVYYATLPLITVKMSNNNYRINLKEGTGFLSAVYSSDGKRPRYDNANPFEIIVTQNIDGFNEDVSLKKSPTYAVTYEWSYLGRIYEKKWILSSNLEDRILENCLANQKAIKPLDDYDGQCVTNAIECVVRKSNVEIGRIHIPIHLMLNRYGNSAINDWDGNSINIDNDGGFILSPQVGAGIKENDNSFTGVIMGKVKEANQSSADVGLIGYARGIRSIFLDSNTGKAIFGANGKGQITIDPTNNTARIYSGNFNYKPDGTGTGLEIDLTTPQIRFGSGKFEVDKDGNLVAKGGGSIAGWQITNIELYSPAPYTSRKITLDSANTKIYSGLKTTLDSSTVGFHLSPDGLGIVSSGGGKVLIKTNSNTPVIYSNNHNNLTSAAVGFYLSQDGLSLRSNYTKNGATAASNLIFRTNGEPEIYSNSKNMLTSTKEGFYLGGTGLSIGSKLYIDANGLMRAGGGAVANTGKHWEINGDSSNSYISYGTKGNTGSVYLGTSDIQLGKGFSVSAAGLLKVGNLNGRYWTISSKMDSAQPAFISYNHTIATNDAGEVTTGPTIDSTHSNNSMYLGTDGIAIGDKFLIAANNSAVKIMYNTSSLDDNKNNSFYLSTDGLRIGNRFKVKTDDSSLIVGKIDGIHWEINGNSSKAYMAYGSTNWYEADSDNSSNLAVYLGTDGISLGHRFSISRQGVLKTYSGEIGGWTIKRNTLSAGKMELNSNGSIKGGSTYSWSIGTDGTATFNRIKADKGGTIGNCTITENGIHSSSSEGSWYINANGSASFNNISASGGTIGGCHIGSSSIYTTNWSLNSNGSASFSNINASGGKIGGCTISGSSIYTGSWSLNSNGSASFSNVTITGGSLTIGAASINSAGHAKFTDVEVTGGSIKLGGTTLNSSGTKLTAGNTKVGDKSLQTYVEDLVVGKLTAEDATITASLNVGNSTYYLRMGQGTKNPEVSGLNIGPKGIKLNNGKSGQTEEKGIRVISSIDDLKISVEHTSIVGISTPLISSITVTLDYKYRNLYFYDGICYNFGPSDSDSKTATDS